MHEKYCIGLRKNLLLPFKKKVIFIDWFGVLTHTVFWEDYLSNSNSKYHKSASHLVSCIFQDQQLVNEWMLGNTTYNAVLEKHLVDSAANETIGLTKALLNYCKNVVLNPDVCSALSKVSSKAFIVLATDNMDVFVTSLPKLREIHLFDSLLASNIVGALKKDNPRKFFEVWLKNQNLEFKDALLIDDIRSNCKAFEECGGTSILYDSANKEDILEKMTYWLNNN